MPNLHDPAVRDAIRSRIQRLTEQSPRKWGKMTVDQMLWHCNESLENSLGKPASGPMKFPLPRAIIRFAVFNLPWPKGAPTHPDLVAGERHSLETERARALRLLDEFGARSVNATNWGESPAFGKMSGDEWGRLQAKHLDHHLRQFSA
ncbi:MAG TPA: DUF1569 domain-containing protein [Gemmatimonadaceae bacterium]|nr:DUF1569 domain-containing protein [Gemmatimonadaceae bacterium]